MLKNKTNTYTSTGSGNQDSILCKVTYIFFTHLDKTQKAAAIFTFWKCRMVDDGAPGTWKLIHMQSNSKFIFGVWF